MQSLQDRLADVLRDLDLAIREVEKLKAKEEIIRDMIREARGEPKVKLSAPRANVKQTVLQLLEQAAADGLNAATAVEKAARAGVALERGTVSSLLSRLKNEGVVVYDGSVYRLAMYKGDSGPNVLPLRTSGVFP